jgi:hypothetical protein
MLRNQQGGLRVTFCISISSKSYIKKLEIAEDLSDILGNFSTKAEVCKDEDVFE